MTRVLVVANQKGGVAKTTTVASLGAAMVEKSKGESEKSRIEEEEEKEEETESFWKDEWS